MNSKNSQEKLGVVERWASSAATNTSNHFKVQDCIYCIVSEEMHGTLPLNNPTPHSAINTQRDAQQKSITAVRCANFSNLAQVQLVNNFRISS